MGPIQVDIPIRLMEDAATAADATPEASELSICEPGGLVRALDFDVIFSCVDRPWPRYVLNTIAYADLILVVDGGIHIDPLPGGGMRGAIWRSHVAGPGRICLACNGQFLPSDVGLEMDGSLDSPAYIAGLLAGHSLKARQNVSLLAVNCAGALLAQFVSLVVAPAGLGDPGPIRYHLAMHWLQHDAVNTCITGCPYPRSIGDGDRRFNPTRSHEAAERERSDRHRASRRPSIAISRRVDDAFTSLRRRLTRALTNRAKPSSTR